MSEKILYVIGAGASAKVLPLARSFFGSDGELVIPGLAHELFNFNFDHYFTDLKEPDNIKFIKKLKKQFKFISEQSDKFGDVDTYAKYLNLLNPGGTEIISLKEILSAYFIFKQKFLDVRDERYLPWLVSIMNKKRFPENVKILSWNYDFQLELAASSFGQLDKVSHKQYSYDYSTSWIGYIPNLDPSFKEYEEVSLVHLNGIAGYVKKEEAKIGSIYNDLLSNDIEDMLKFMQENKMGSMINFVWENNGYHDKIINELDKIILGSTILVVIGYSFPFFNRDVDKKIFKLLTSENKLKKIYFQNPTLDGRQLKSQFDLDSSIEIVHIAQTDYFHIPFEY